MGTRETLYRRPLPSDAIAFSSPAGRRLFAEALAAGGLDGYSPLAEQLHTQSDPAFCGLGSLVVALDALGIDPGRPWKGPWRWFAESSSIVACRSLKFGSAASTSKSSPCLARCNGADVEIYRADATNLDAFRAALGLAARAKPF